MTLDGKMFPYKKQIFSLFDLAGKTLKENFSNVNLSVNFVSEKEIKKLNEKFRKVEKETDVLSFPNLQKSCDQSLADFAGEIVDGQLFLGDIVICKKIAKRQAKQYGHSVKREICFLALHGLLHLLGFDHIEKSDEKRMQSMAERILKDFGVSR